MSSETNGQIKDGPSIIQQPEEKDDLKKMIFDLDLSVRDRLIAFLNQSNAQLIYDDNDTINKDDLIQDFKKLIIILSNLPMKPDQQTDKSTGSMKLILELDYDFKNKLINHLAENRDCICYAQSVTTEKKTNLTNKNFKMITTLINLSMRTVQCDSDQISGQRNKKDQQLMDDIIKRFDIKLYGLNQRINEVVQLSNDVAKVSKEVSEMNEKMKMIEENLRTLSETIYRYEFQDAGQFANSVKRADSSRFYCRHIPWYLSIQSFSKDGKHIIGLFLYSDYDEESDWSIEANYQFKLVNQSSSINSKIMSGNPTLTKALPARGLTNLIDESDLTDSSKGFIKDGKIIVEVHVKADQIIRK